jgi:hypothetical protein
MILSTTDEILGALERGDLAKDFAAAVREVLSALGEMDAGAGGVSLKLKFSARGDMVSVKAKLETQLPPKERKSSNFFLTGDGRLSLQHPEQISMGFDRRRDAADVL